VEIKEGKIDLICALPFDKLRDQYKIIKATGNYLPVAFIL